MTRLLMALCGTLFLTTSALQADGGNPNNGNDWLLKTAVVKGDSDLIEIFFKYGRERGIPALSKAISVGDYNAATILIVYGVDVNARGVWGPPQNHAQTALELSIEKGASGLIEPLLIAGADPYLPRFVNIRSRVDGNGNTQQDYFNERSTAIYEAILFNRLSDLKTMHKCGVTFNNVCVQNIQNGDNLKPLQVAISLGKRDIAEFLISIGAKP